jgi:hypothetical protein
MSELRQDTHRAGSVRGKRRIRPARIVIAGVFLLVAVVAGVYTVSTYLTDQGYPKDMKGNPVAVSKGSLGVDETHAVSQVGGMMLQVPSTGLNVPLGELDEVDGVINPPGFSSAYLVRNYGSTLEHAKTGAVFVAMHSCRGGAVCPGNYLINVDAGTASVKTGADVYVDGLHYRVTGWQKVYKPDIGSDTTVWANTPGKLVLFTCLQIPAQTESIDNMVVTAKLVTQS